MIKVLGQLWRSLRFGDAVSLGKSYVKLSSMVPTIYCAGRREICCMMPTIHLLNFDIVIIMRSESVVVSMRSMLSHRLTQHKQRKRLKKRIYIPHKCYSRGTLISTSRQSYSTFLETAVDLLTTCYSAEVAPPCNRHSEKGHPLPTHHPSTSNVQPTLGARKLVDLAHARGKFPEATENTAPVIIPRCHATPCLGPKPSAPRGEGESDVRSRTRESRELPLV
jgi:hypothetical protein